MEENKNNSGQAEKAFIKKLKKALGLKYIIGIAIGGISGFLYYYFVGCASGACPMKSNPYLNIIMGVIVGYLVADLVKNKKES